ncbi:hypothetical protein Tcan_00573, partial [Toxocara canis]
MIIKKNRALLDHFLYDDLFGKENDRTETSTMRCKTGRLALAEMKSALPINTGFTSTARKYALLVPRNCYHLNLRSHRYLLLPHIYHFTKTMFNSKVKEKPLIF